MVLVVVGFRKHTKKGLSKTKDRPSSLNSFYVKLGWLRLLSKTSSGL
jgi:hypothetical protein